MVSETTNTFSKKLLANAQIQLGRNPLPEALFGMSGGGSAKSAAGTNPPPPHRCNLSNLLPRPHWHDS